MDRTFTPGEFHSQVFGSNKLNTDFLNKWINIYCIRNWFQQTPLIWAVCNGHLDMVKYLVENGANITADSNRAVQWAAIEGHLEIIKYLLNTYIYSEEDIHGYATNYLIKNDIIKELLLNYKKFSTTKACKY